MTESLRDIADRIVQTATSTSASAHHVLVHRQLIGKLREALRSTPEPQDCPCGAFPLDGQMLHAPSCTRVIHDAEAAGLCLVIPVGQTRPVHPRCAQYPDCPCGGPQPDETEVTLEGLMSWGLRPLDHCAELSMRFISMDHAIAARELIRRRAGLLGGTAEKTEVPHKQGCAQEEARLDGRDRWYMVSCTCAAPDVPDEPLCDHGIPVHSPSACPSCHSSSPRRAE